MNFPIGQMAGKGTSHGFLGRQSISQWGKWHPILPHLSGGLKYLKVSESQDYTVKKTLFFQIFGVPKAHLSPGKENLIKWVRKPSLWPHITAILTTAGEDTAPRLNCSGS